MAVRRRALLLCPGRGSYNRAELGSLAGRDSRVLDLFDELRAAAGLPGPREIDAAPRFSPRLHLAGEHASILTAAATLADVEAIDADRHEIAVVCGNSMGWYTALGAAGALSLEDCGRLVDTMGRYQQDNVIGGQIVYPLVDDDWLPDPGRTAAVEQALASIPGLYWSIHLGGQAVLGGTEQALAEATRSLPPIASKGLEFPLRLPLHSAFHTPLLAESRTRAEEDLGDLGWQDPAIPMIDGRGAGWRPRTTDPLLLRDYTLGHQVTEPFDFSTMMAAALGDYAPEVVILAGPGSNLGGAVAQVMVKLGWRGLRSRADFMRLQEQAPILLSMGRPDQRGLVTGR